ncbi:MAG TPA: YraN family protein [Marmoricola sp.]|jgi:putative endonuclease|nr:YraN family protein [Marmoricola sp.]
MTTARQRQALGAYGERVAARYLDGLGMKVIDRNWRCRSGEIDLVLLDREVIVVCEVRTRRGLGYGHPLATVGPTKAARLRQLALLWVDAHRGGRPAIRLDLVGVVQPLRGRVEIEHVRGIG